MASAEVDVQLVLVTGASGYIASHVVQQLLKNGYRVRGTVRSKKNATKVQHLLNLCPDAQHELELVEADLLDVESWKPAVDGCSHVIHVASPFPSEAPKHEDEIIKPALEGTLNVLKACQNAGTVKRVVVTSSIAAVSGGFTGESNVVFSEKDWPNVDTIGTYEKSKTLAEKAAWDFVDKLKVIFYVFKI
uniref:Bifunctional dihydroflavonol 4-reductase/flavanone 4-reductase-like n=1 Tax=Saccoglossus kowalevskii TaxID=10224 RepID=A0ABM0MV94_SACKO|nr:PREDICTED: bifunctional dihydroflavonol 4-reductase/flavanone 4-reductase-like [Saccoglossus kowalevskii]